MKDQHSPPPILSNETKCDMKAHFEALTDKKYRLETDLSWELQSKINAFCEETGLKIDGISVSIEDCTAFGSLKPGCLVSRVRIHVAL